MGQTFAPEVVPGLVAETATVVALDRPAATAAGSFAGCAVLRVEDDRGAAVERTLCPGVGLVREAAGGGGEAGEGGEEEGEAPEGGIELVKLGP